MRVVKERANAKINLYLDVIARREDGFHDIKTVMHSVSLFDEIKLTYTPSKATRIRMMVKGSRFLPVDDRNLAVKAAKLFLETAGENAYIDISLEKHIPVSAGLAGGSSDAAATLRAMNKVFNRMFTEKALYSMAAKLGSDVPYCLYGKTALCEGRGEIITKLPDTLKLNILIAASNERVSTPTAYGELDNIYSSFDGSVKTGGENSYKSLLSAIYEGGKIDFPLYNVFEEAVMPKCPNSERIKARLLELGATCALMSGSGPSVFGIFGSGEAAVSAGDVLKSEGVNVYLAKTV